MDEISYQVAASTSTRLRPLYIKRKENLTTLGSKNDACPRTVTPDDPTSPDGDVRTMRICKFLLNAGMHHYKDLHIAVAMGAAIHNIGIPITNSVI